MKKQFFIFSIFLFFILPFASIGQNDPILISIKIENQSLDKTLREIQKKYDLELAYNSKLFRQYRVSETFESTPIIEAINTLIKVVKYEVIKIGDVLVCVPIPENKMGSSNNKNFEWSTYIIDQETKEILPYAIVTIKSTGETKQSDENGYLYFKSLPSDTSTLILSYIGYEYTKIQLSPSMISEDQRLSLNRNLNLISQVPIYGEGNPIVRINEDDPLTEIDKKTARLFPGLGENDLLRMVQYGAGTNGTGERAGSINIRGGESDETTILFDGFTIYHVDHFYSLFSAINGNAVKHVQIHKGWYEPKYGGRTAGIIEITGKEGNENYKETQLDVNLTSASFFFENPLPDKKSTIAISARRSFTDVINSPLYEALFNNIYNESLRNNGEEINTFGESSPPDFHFSDLNIKYTYRLNPNNKINLSLYYGRDKLNISYSSSNPEFNQNSTFVDESEWGNVGMSARWNKKWNRRFNSRLTLSQSTYSSDLFAVDFRENTLLLTNDTINVNRKNDLIDRSLQLDNDWYLSNHKISVGANVVYNLIQFKEIDDGGNISDASESGFLSSFYLQDDWKYGRLHMKGGIRLPYFTENNSLEFEPRMLASIEFGNRWYLHSSYARNHQYIRRISRQNLFLNTPDIWVLSNDQNIPILQSDQITAGLSKNLGKVSIKAESYVRFYEGSLYDVSNTNLYFLRGENSLSAGKKNVRGIDLSILKSEGKHKFWFASTLSLIKNTDHSIIPYEFTSDHDQLLEIKGSYLFRIKGWSFSAYAIYGSGRPHTPAIGTYNLDLVGGEQKQVLAYADLNSDRLPAYHRMDIAVTKHFLFPTSNQAEIGISIFNVYDRINISDRRYYFLENQGGLGEVESYDVEMLGILPSIKLKYTF